MRKLSTDAKLILAAILLGLTGMAFGIHDLTQIHKADQATRAEPVESRP